MKKIFIIIAVCSPILFTACENTEIGFGDVYNEEKTDYLIDLEKTDNLTLDAEAQELSLRVGANYWWRVSTEFVHQEDEYETNWFSILSDDENFGNQPIQVAFSRNIEQRNRAVKLVFTAQNDPNIKREITITQSSAELFLELDTQEKNLSILSQSFEVTLSVSDKWTVEKPNWVTLDKEEGTPTRDEILTVTVDLNNTDADRNGALVFKSKSDAQVKQTLSISQSGVFNAPEIAVINDENLTVEFNTDPATEYYTVDVYKNGDSDNLLAQQKIETFDAVESFDLTTLNFGDYVGNIDVKVSAYLSESYFKSSAVSTTHNYFDSASGDGSSAEQACIVKNLRHFANVSKALDKYIRQEVDLDMATVELIPIGISSQPFAGTYDGNGKKMKNLAFESVSAGAPAAIFPYVSGTIKNLTAEKVNLTPKHAAPTGTGSAIFVGLLKKGALVDNCHLIDCQIETVTNGVLMAGIVGYNDRGVVKNCTVSGGSISSTKGCSIGGIVGINGSAGETEESLIEHCENKGMTIKYNTTGAVNADVGGIAYASHHTIRGCINRAEIYGTRFVGGIVATPVNPNADANNLTLDECANYGNIYFKPNAATSICGGIIGRLISSDVASGAIATKCFNQGNITIEASKTNTLVGGISGRGNAIRMIDCYNTGSIINNSGANSVYMGGLCGDNNGASISYSYSAGLFVNPSNKVGAITGSAVSCTFTRCFYLSSLPSSTEGPAPLIEAQMKNQLSFIEWNFDNTWTIDATKNNGYPTLQCFNK